MSKITLDENELKTAIYAALHDKLQAAINYTEIHRLIDVVIEERGDELRQLLGDCLDSVLANPDFRTAIIDEFKHKAAKTMVAKMDGAIEKSVNKFRQDPALNAKMILAIEKIINEEQS